MWFFEKLNTPIAVVVVSVLVLVVDGFFLYRYQGPIGEAGNMSANQPNTGPASSPETTGEANGLRVDVRVVGTPTWLRVQEDGQTVMDQANYSPGFSRRFEANREVRIRTEDAGATWVEADGRAAGPLGGDGEEGTYTFMVGP
jgi:hypothetical protein